MCVGCQPLGRQQLQHNAASCACSTKHLQQQQQHLVQQRCRLMLLVTNHFCHVQATKSKFPHVVFGETPAQHQRTGDGKQCAAARGKQGLEKPPCAAIF
jgi:hypothetical protein